MLNIFSKVKAYLGQMAYRMNLIRIVLRNSKILVSGGWKGLWSFGQNCTNINISHVLICNSRTPYARSIKMLPVQRWTCAHYMHPLFCTPLFSFSLTHRNIKKMVGAFHLEYIGETSRRFGTRLGGHKPDVDKWYRKFVAKKLPELPGGQEKNPSYVHLQIGDYGLCGR